MTMTGITATVVNGVQEISTAHLVTGTATASDESLLMIGSAYLRASTTGVITIQRCILFVNDLPSNYETNQAVLSYNGDSTSRTDTSASIRIQQSHLQVRGTARRNFFLSELTQSSIREVNATKQYFVYTCPGAIMNEVSFYGISVWEIVGAPSVFYKVSVDNCGNGYLNWEAGRLDIYYFKATNCGRDAWHNSGPNHHWNNVSFNRNNIDGGVSRYREGWTTCWEFQDTSFAKIQDALLILRDDFDTGGSFAEVGRWTTNANGRLSGTKDSRTRTTGSDTERGALFIQTGNGNGGWRVVQPRIEIRSYGHLADASYGPASNFSISAPIGTLSSTGAAETFSAFFMPVDTNLVATKATALAYTELETAQKLYDRAKAEWRDNDGYPLLTKTGSVVSLTTFNLTLNNGAGTAYAFATGTITIKTAALTGSVALTSGVLSAALTDGGAYTYTGGTLTDSTALPWLEAGTIGIGGAATFAFNTTGTVIVNASPTAPSTYNLTGTHEGTLDLRNLTAHAITIQVPAGVITTTANNTGGTITVSVPSVSYTLTLTGIVAGSEVRAYTGSDPSTAVEIAATESSGTTFNITHSGGNTAGYIAVRKTDYKFVKILVTYGNASSSLSVSQPADPWYRNP